MKNFVMNLSGTLKALKLKLNAHMDSGLMYLVYQDQSQGANNSLELCPLIDIEIKGEITVKINRFAKMIITSASRKHTYNFDPLKPHFYIEKLGFTGVYIIFLISAQKHRLWVLVRTASSRQC